MLLIVFLGSRRFFFATFEHDVFILRFFFFQAEDGIRDHCVTGFQTCALPIYLPPANDQLALAPDFSPDGKRIVFPHDMSGALELYVINADGTGLIQITYDGLGHAAPRWSPRSEERRVGKECRSRWSQYHAEKK